MASQQSDYVIANMAMLIAGDRYERKFNELAGQMAAQSDASEIFNRVLVSTYLSGVIDAVKLYIGVSSGGDAAEYLTIIDGMADDLSSGTYADGGGDDGSNVEGQS